MQKPQQELDLHNMQAIVAQLDVLYGEVNLDQSTEYHLAITGGEYQESVDAWIAYKANPCKETRDHLAGEVGDVLFCALAILNDLGADANAVMHYVFDKNLGRVNREHIANMRQQTGLDGKSLYKAAKAEHDTKYDK